MPPQKVAVGRVALRVEGEWWIGYWAPRQDSMEGAVQIASVRMIAAANDQAVKDAFLNLMRNYPVRVGSARGSVAPTGRRDKAGAS